MLQAKQQEQTLIFQEQNTESISVKLDAANPLGTLKVVLMEMTATE
jgi:hypothetical protein